MTPLEPDELGRVLERATQLHGKGRFDEAAPLYQQVEAHNPEVLAAPYFLALMDLETGWLERALQRLRFVTSRDPASFEPLFALAHAFEELGLWPQAVAAYRQARTVKPESTAARFALAHALEVAGQVDEAIELYRGLGEIQATRLRALIGVAKLRSSAITEAERQEMTVAAGDPNTPPGLRIGLLFSLGETLEASGRFDDAFAAFLEANRLRRQQLIDARDNGQDLVIAPPAARARMEHPEAAAARHAEWVARETKTFTPQFVARHAGKGLDRARPIFVVGMPRSGSTLIEQILSSHDEVQGLGEGPALWRTIGHRFPYAPGLTEADLPPHHFVEAAEEYLARQRGYGWRDAPVLVDKMLGNYMSIGMIHLMFPRAVILHSVRDPVDTCLGCFRQMFRSGNETTYDLRDIAAHYIRYREMMRHWETVLPGRVVSVVHEDLVAHPGTKIRWLVEDVCGLPWDEACLSFHRSERPVRTASVAQVRRPLFRDGVQRWRHYEAHLQPLLDALGPYAPVRR